MSSKKPLPMFTSRQRKVCPVCGEVSYSQAGVHPQCAQTQADQKRVDRYKRSAKALRKTAKVASKDADIVLKPWHKRCPKCKKQVHIRKSACLCGHKFTSRSG